METEAVVTTKRCTKCGEEKTLGSFGGHPMSKHGVRPECKICKAAYDMARRSQRLRLEGENFRKADREKSRIYRSAHLDRYRENARKHTKAYREQNPTKVREAAKAYREQNPSKAREAVKRCLANNPDLMKLARHKRRARMRTTTFERISLLDIIARDGLACYICGVETDPNAPPRTLTKAELEHILSLCMGGTHTWDNLAVACHRCNALKGAYKTPEQVRQLLCIAA
jgi:5-methylcytosine-specific restriction endonuclease McrA